MLEITSLQRQITSLIGLLPQIFVAFLILFVGMLAATFSRAPFLGVSRAAFARVFSETIRFVIALLLFHGSRQIGLNGNHPGCVFHWSSVRMMGLAIAFGLGSRHWLGEFKHFVHNERSEDELSPL